MAIGTMLKRILTIWIVVCFLLTSILPTNVSAQMLNLPVPGSLVGVSKPYMPVTLKGVQVHQEDPFLFDFIVDSGDSQLKIDGADFKAESQKLVRYFLAALTIKEEDLWVNLSPYEKDRMIPAELGQTEMGRDMLAQDYVLKQLTASMLYPEGELGKAFWSKVYKQAKEQFGTTDIPVDTFNKVWISADKAKVLERSNTAYVVSSHLKVMLESDYAAQAQNAINALSMPKTSAETELAKNVIRSIILPEIEKQVNEGEHFAPLRQMFYGMILAAWYKRALKESLLNQVYSDKNKTAGVLADDPQVKEKIYQQYLEAFRKGAFNLIREENDASGQPVPRKYFSGGLSMMVNPFFAHDAAELTTTELVGLDKSSVLLNVRMKGIDLAQKTEKSAELHIDVKANEHVDLGIDSFGVAWGETPINLSDPFTAKAMAEIVRMAGLPEEKDAKKLGVEGGKIIVIVNTRTGERMMAGIILDRGVIIHLAPVELNYGEYLTLLMFHRDYDLINLSSGRHLIRLPVNDVNVVRKNNHEFTFNLQFGESIERPEQLAVSPDKTEKALAPARNFPVMYTFDLPRVPDSFFSSSQKGGVSPAAKLPGSFSHIYMAPSPDEAKLFDKLEAKMKTLGVEVEFSKKDLRFVAYYYIPTHQGGGVATATPVALVSLAIGADEHQARVMPLTRERDLVDGWADSFLNYAKKKTRMQILPSVEGRDFFYDSVQLDGAKVIWQDLLEPISGEVIKQYPYIPGSLVFNFDDAAMGVGARTIQNATSGYYRVVADRIPLVNPEEGDIVKKKMREEISQILRTLRDIQTDAKWKSATRYFLERLRKRLATAMTVDHWEVIRRESEGVLNYWFTIMSVRDGVPSMAQELGRTGFDEVKADILEQLREIQSLADNLLSRQKITEDGLAAVKTLPLTSQDQARAILNDLMAKARKNAGIDHAMASSFVSWLRSLNFSHSEMMDMISKSKLVSKDQVPMVMHKIQSLMADEQALIAFVHHLGVAPADFQLAFEKMALLTAKNRVDQKNYPDSLIEQEKQLVRVGGVALLVVAGIMYYFFPQWDQWQTKEFVMLGAGTFGLVVLHLLGKWLLPLAKEDIKIERFAKQFIFDQRAGGRYTRNLQVNDVAVWLRKSQDAPKDIDVFNYTAIAVMLKIRSWQNREMVKDAAMLAREPKAAAYQTAMLKLAKELEGKEFTWEIRDGKQDIIHDHDGRDYVRQAAGKWLKRHLWGETYSDEVDAGRATHVLLDRYLRMVDSTITGSVAEGFVVKAAFKRTAYARTIEAMQAQDKFIKKVIKRLAPLSREFVGKEATYRLDDVNYDITRQHDGRDHGRRAAGKWLKKTLMGKEKYRLDSKAGWVAQALLINYFSVKTVAVSGSVEAGFDVTFRLEDAAMTTEVQEIYTPELAAEEKVKIAAFLREARRIVGLYDGDEYSRMLLKLLSDIEQKVDQAKAKEDWDGIPAVFAYGTEWLDGMVAQLTMAKPFKPAVLSDAQDRVALRKELSGVIYAMAKELILMSKLSGTEAREWWFSFDRAMTANMKRGENLLGLIEAAENKVASNKLSLEDRGHWLVELERLKKLAVRAHEAVLREDRMIDDLTALRVVAGQFINDRDVSLLVAQGLDIVENIKRYTAQLEERETVPMFWDMVDAIDYWELQAKEMFTQVINMKKPELLSLGVPVERVKAEDKAMKEYGGIDLNAHKMALDREGSASAMNIVANPSVMAQFQSGHFSGLEAVILSVTPMANSRQILGLAENIK